MLRIGSDTRMSDGFLIPESVTYLASRLGGGTDKNPGPVHKTKTKKKKKEKPKDLKMCEK